MPLGTPMNDCFCCYRCLLSVVSSFVRCLVLSMLFVVGDGAVVCCCVLLLFCVVVRSVCSVSGGMKRAGE